MRLLLYGEASDLTGTIVLGAGAQFGMIIDRNTIYYGDLTSFVATVGSIPEPATWAMLFAGFGLVGFSARRRKTFVTA